ncbi:BA75_00932T0 [Komagataella pastoris]|uniref:Phosphatidylinositol 4-kinase n=1 Tax=Komagataella pastoris TaxID=4922 RepID=A0A1B2J7G7_PICPA|nr:BA75_00932T0 [Komagataella pastoris]
MDSKPLSGVSFAEASNLNLDPSVQLNPSSSINEYYPEPANEFTEQVGHSPSERDTLLTQSPNYNATSPSQGASRSPLSKKRRTRSLLSTDKLKSINTKLGKWTRGLSYKWWIVRSKDVEGQPSEILFSVFMAPPYVQPLKRLPAGGLMNMGPTSREDFALIVDDVIDAIEQGIKPTRISQGSSGSYFMYSTQGKIVGVFKPKDEEPYGPLSPKWTKWIHRNLFPCFFGRSCLIPNLGYIAESAASLLDRQLQSFIVPYTDTVMLSSSSFYYDFWDRCTHAWSKKPYRKKVGSFQLYLNGFIGADEFFKKYPLPADKERSLLPFLPDKRKKKTSKKKRQRGDTRHSLFDKDTVFEWNRDTLQQLREQLEKLVILDYIIRNTDRAFDNWMIKVEWDEYLDEESNEAYKRPNLKVRAIDSGLAFPWKHPNEWRSFPFGWLYLPTSVIARPFSERTRRHYLPLLTSKEWWEETSVLFREMFSRDTEFKERMWRRQWAVLKGQAFNVVETLKIPGQSPLDLVQKTRIMVWDNVVEIPVSYVPRDIDIYNDSPVWTYQNYDEEYWSSNIAHNSPGRYHEPEPTTPESERLDDPFSSAASTDRGSYANGSTANTPGRANTDSIQKPTTATRRLIVERLETITSKPPVFTWC